MDYTKLSIEEIREGVASGKFTAVDVVLFFKKRCELFKDYNAVVEVFDDVVIKAETIDKKIKNGESIGKLAGVPIAIKDNILSTGHKASCASKFMKNFVSPYSASIVKKLEAEDAIIFGRCNMDEFAMGGSTEKSCHGVCKNAIDKLCVAGGSSGGSAVAVALSLVPCAIGTDTGGSIRQPASFNGVVGIKPTYGTVSRFGIVAYASGLDQASPIAKTTKECELVFKIMAGKDFNDNTTIDNHFDKKEIKEKYTIGILKELMEKYKSMPTYSKFSRFISSLKYAGHNIVEVSVPHLENALACYYILASAEAASNLSRFDGIKYAERSQNARTLSEVYTMSRTEGFGEEVKRRIMLGNFVLSSNYFDAYYRKSKKAQILISSEFEMAFNNCDAIILPTTPGEAFKIGEKSNDPVAMFLEDLFTVPANIAGIPAISVPYEKGENNLPLGIQVMGAKETENILFDIALKIEKLNKEKKA